MNNVITGYFPKFDHIVSIRPLSAIDCVKVMDKDKFERIRLLKARKAKYEAMGLYKLSIGINEYLKELIDQQ